VASDTTALGWVIPTAANGLLAVRRGAVENRRRGGTRNERERFPV
jgi:hypothetical protein